MRTATDTTLRNLAMLAAIPVQPRSKSTRQILEELRDKDPDFDVNVRSIQRSLARLSQLFPITSETRGRTNFWFWIEPNALTQIPEMSQSTAFVLRLANEYLRPIMPPATLQVLDPYFSHAERILDATALGRWTDRAAIIAPGLTLLPAVVSAEVHEAVYEALMSHRKIEVRYRGKHEDESKPIVLSPLGIVVRTGIIYLVATAWKYGDIRHYVLHRMSEPNLMDEPVETPRDFQLKDHLGADGPFAYPADGDKLELRALFDAGAGAHLTECRLAADHQATQLEDGRVLVEATVADTAQLRWWLSSFGGLVEVLGPPSLRKGFREEAQRLAAIYQPDAIEMSEADTAHTGSDRGTE